MVSPAHRRFRRGWTALILALCASAHALEYKDAWSPRNAERPIRDRTYYIILHTTEAPKESALNKLRSAGETHFLVDTAGKIYRIMDQRRVALHCGRSMWKGLADIDQYSVGVEVVGRYNSDITSAQYAAIKELLLELQRTFHIPDNRVLTHSMVAYGAPNRWHLRSHRGRKRCGMLFATTAARRKLGLAGKPACDPDVDAGRLVVADPYLARVLYGVSAKQQEDAVTRFAGEANNVISRNRSAWDIARDRYASAETVYILPDGARKRGSEIRDWGRVPIGTRVALGKGTREDEDSEEPVKEVGADGKSAGDLVGDEARNENTIYILPDGKIKRGSELTPGRIAAMPAGTRALVGYTIGGQVTARRSAFDICGIRWKLPSTYCLMPCGKLVKGDKMDESAIPKNAVIFLRE
ncbi:MAG: N-acetylmuramoyl-L-alanine amidase [Verrucomicrobiota bacterium]|nr:N-acetylmuramoyl-L-alanine amidase [Verrucomicrobiota bacterium]